MKCKKCDAPVRERRIVDGHEVLACDPCWKNFLDDIETSRRDYRTMIAAGFSEELAMRFIDGEVGLA